MTALIVWAMIGVCLAVIVLALCLAAAAGGGDHHEGRK